MSFKVFSIAGVDIKLHALSVPVILAFIIFEMLDILLTAFFLLTMHELCHAYMAKRLCAQIDCIEIQPCGFTARITDKTIPLRDELAIALAGPVFSIVCGAIILCVTEIVGFKTDMLCKAGVFSIVLGIINLVPALPLDGGRILKSLLSRVLSHEVCNRVCVGLGFIISVGIIALGIYGFITRKVNLTLSIMGVVMLFGSICELRHSGEERLKCMLKKKNTIAGGRRLDMSFCAFSEQTDIKTALAMLNLNRFNVVEVIDCDMNIVASLDEGELLRCASIDRSMTLKDAVRLLKNERR